jgi:hypothetical protein
MEQFLRHKLKILLSHTWKSKFQKEIFIRNILATNNVANCNSYLLAMATQTIKSV